MFTTEHTIRAALSPGCAPRPRPSWSRLRLPSGGEEAAVRSVSGGAAKKEPDAEAGSAALGRSTRLPGVLHGTQPSRTPTHCSATERERKGEHSIRKKGRRKKETRLSLFTGAISKTVCVPEYLRSLLTHPGGVTATLIP